jgi:subtilase family serine protease
MFCKTAILRLFSGLCLLGIMEQGPAWGADWKILPGHVPAATRQLVPEGRLSATNQLSLAIGLPLRQEDQLDELLRQLYDPASTNFHKFLTSEEFTARFGPTEADYAAVRNFAETNGFVVVGTHPNRVVLDVRARSTEVETALHITLRTYRHPTENRDFFAPDEAPVVAAAMPILSISGLDNYSRRQPRSVVRSLTAMPMQVTPQTGSGTSGSYLGGDFRAAYVPGTALTGSGQSVALVQFDGYYSNDIASYISKAGLTNYAVSLTNVAVNGGVSTPGSGNGEVCLDIEMVLSMAPGVSKIIVYEAPSSGTAWSTMLSKIANDNLARQISCSWGDSSVGSTDSTSEALFKQMAAQGQSFFNASGDSDAFVGGIPFPSESTNITQVGGTTLSTASAGGVWSSETAWNWGYVARDSGYVGTSGGISTHYGIPGWQQGISMTNNHGSSTYRNVPDVALTGDNVFVTYSNGLTSVFGGTSCAAPLWAGFMALVNQQMAINTGSTTNSAGFINPAIYAIGKGSNVNYSYSACFNDITTGNNYWSSSTTNFPAVTGFDLCTGWGTPTIGLLTALAGVADSLGISPAAGGAFYGVTGGPFSPASTNLLLTNTSTSALVWSLINTSAWLSVSTTNGTLASGRFTNLTVKVIASSLATGTYTASLRFTNQTSHLVQMVPFSLQISNALAVAPISGFTAAGGYGGPFSVTSQTYVLTNQGGTMLNWSINNTSSWLSASSVAGTLAAGGSAAVTVSLSALATNLPVGTNQAALTFSNQTGGASLARSFGLQVQQPQLVTNGGFEAGNFTGWTLANNTPNTNSSLYTYNYNVVTNSAYTGIVYAGTYGAALGDTNLMSLSQPLATTPGQRYLLSLWLRNNTGGSGQKFVVNWNTNSPATNTLFSWSGTNSFSWTNLLFVVGATGTNSVLQFQAMNLPYFFGLDNVSVMPVPVPTFTGSSCLSGSGATHGFSFSWNTLAGVTYQVQYKTNLLQTDWLVLSNFTATASSVNFTNFPGADPCRFYRIRSLP